MNTPQEPQRANAVTESRRKRTVWKIAPNVPKKKRGIRFSIGTLLVIVSFAGPLLAAAFKLDREFYQLNAKLIGGVAICCLTAFAISFCRTYWALAILVLAILCGFSAQVALVTNRFHLGEADSLKLFVLSCGTMISAGSGFLLSCSRHQH